METNKIINELGKKLEDEEYRNGWIANIAMSFLDSEIQYKKEYKKEYLNRGDKHIIANNAAKNFLNILSKKS